MKYKVRHIVMALAMLPAMVASAQEAETEKYAIKATADIGLGRALSLDYAIDGMTASSSANNFGVDFGMIVWNKDKHSIEANAGLWYGSTSLKTNLPAMDYHYSAPSDADMDGDTYLRYYELDGVYQKMRVDRISIPIYANYGYRINQALTLHAMLGFRFGFNITSKMNDSKADVFSYGVYPQYDDLMIDATYMNEFGSAQVGASASMDKAKKFTPSFLAGLGAEYRVYGPFAVDLSFRYEGAMSNLFSTADKITSFDATNSPVTYTVAEGQKLKALPYYFTKSKLSRFGIAISILYRF